MPHLRRSHPAPPPRAAFRVRERTRADHPRPRRRSRRLLRPPRASSCTVCPVSSIPRCASHVYRTIARRRAASSQTSDASAVFASRLTKTLGAIQRRRKARNMALRAATRDEDDEFLPGKGKARADAREQCPVCMRDIEGDPDVVAAHVDACLAHAELELADDTEADEDTPLDVDVDVEERDDGDDDVDLWEESEGPDGVRRLRLRGGSRAAAAAATALGFAVGNRTAQDVEDEIDVEGDDLGTFGAAQFTEADVLAEGGEEGRREGVVGLDVELERVRHAKDSQEFIYGLENKVQQLAVRPYNTQVVCCLLSHVHRTPRQKAQRWGVVSVSRRTASQR
jgi:hypothetical protein